MNLTPSPHDPCLFSGIINETDLMSTREEVFVGAYVDDCVFYSTDPAEEEKFKTALQDKLKVDFMGNADYFLAPRLHG